MEFLPLDTKNIKPAKWIIKHIIECGTVSLLYGDSFCGKTYLALYIAYCIITGRKFAGYPVKRTGTVLYLCGEGRSGIERRLRALEIATGKSIGDRFLISDTSASLINEYMNGNAETRPDNSLSLIGAIKQTSEEFNEPVLFIIDTWARNLGGDENSAQDTGNAIAEIDRIRFQFPEIAVLIVHHTGQSAKDRARGSYSLKCAVDVEMQLDKDKNDNLARLTFTKMKDGDVPDPLAFRFRGISLNIFDEDGEELRSAIVEPTEYIPPAKSGSAGRGKNQTLAKEVLSELWKSKPENTQGISAEVWRNACVEKGLDNKRFNQTADSLVSSGEVQNEDHLYSLDLPF